MSSKVSETIYLSGITPSSSIGLHLGNYLGAVKQHVDFQQKGLCFYFIADYHALNTVFSAKDFAHNVYETYLDYMALGIDLEKTVFYVESHVPAIFELTEILKNVVTLGEMKRMHAFKDKLGNPDQDVNTINMGLFNYPILMAADILLFEPDYIPVGEDQTQHVEICREMANTFNNRYGDVIKVPQLYVKENVARVLGTDGERKMSKSLGNVITIFSSEDDIKKQIMSVTTDPNRIKPTDPGDPAKNPIFNYMELMGFDSSRLEGYKERYRSGTIGDVEIKNDFFQYYLEYFKDARRRRSDLASNKNEIVKIMHEQALIANERALLTIEKIRKAIGAIYR